LETDDPEAPSELGPLTGGISKGPTELYRAENKKSSVIKNKIKLQLQNKIEKSMT
jgi:hypothetical protein